MQFTEKTLTIKDGKTGKRQVTAWQGENTGLAYVQSVGQSGKPLKETYNLTHVSSGYALPYTVSTVEEAQTYLEKVANIFEDRWNCKLSVIKKRIDLSLLAQVELAHYDSIDHMDFFLYGLKADGDLACDASTDADGRDPNDPDNVALAEQILADYPEAVKVVMVRMAQADGIHHILRTFERATATAQV